MNEKSFVRFWQMQCEIKAPINCHVSLKFEILGVYFCTIFDNFCTANKYSDANVNLQMLQALACGVNKSTNKATRTPRSDALKQAKSHERVTDFDHNSFKMRMTPADVN